MYKIKIWSARGCIRELQITAEDYTEAYILAVFAASEDEIVLEVIKDA